MNEFYRGHEIVLLDGTPRSAIIIERETGTALPTKVTAALIDNDSACLRKARDLIDRYLEALLDPPDLARRSAR
jgi:hypothetical protein